MNGIILIIVLLVGGIILISSGGITIKKKPREAALSEMAEFLEATVQPLEGYENSYKIDFDHKGKRFTFQDIEEEGFKQKSNKAFLRTKTNTPFTLGFTEQTGKGFKADIVHASSIGKQTNQSLDIPKALHKFSIFANDIHKGNQILRNDKVVAVFSKLKYINDRGKPGMPLRIIDGEVVLEFFDNPARTTNLADLRNSITSIEEYLNQMVTVVEAVVK